MNNDKECDLEGKGGLKGPNLKVGKLSYWVLGRTDHCLGPKLSCHTIPKTMLMLDFAGGWNGPLDRVIHSVECSKAGLVFLLEHSLLKHHHFSLNMSETPLLIHTCFHF